MTEPERIARGNAAHHELRVTEAAFDGVRQLYTDEMTAPDTTEDRLLELHRSLKNLAMVRKALIAAYNDGLMASAQAEAAKALN